MMELDFYLQEAGSFLLKLIARSVNIVQLSAVRVRLFRQVVHLVCRDHDLYDEE